MRIFDLHTLPPLGELPQLIKAIVIRRDREGEPIPSMQAGEGPLRPSGDQAMHAPAMAAAGRK